ncbi:MAG: hypothetical protein EAZ15_10430 [Sphingobacteriales bacterium]|nr:MAG: hypothetical protein EAZ15_10430 [Sphingobacteriales bacterium]
MGTVSTTFKALSSLQSIIFDLSKKMIVSKVTQNGESLFFEQSSNNQLLINLKNTLLASQTATLVI